MTRLLISVMSAGMLSIACGNGESTIMAPSSASAGASITTSAGFVEKYYTVGGIVQSIEKPFLAIEGARIEATGSGNEGRATVSGAGGAYSLALKPGTMPLIVTKEGYAPWTTIVSIFEPQPDVRVTLQPIP